MKKIKKNLEHLDFEQDFVFIDNTKNFTNLQYNLSKSIKIKFTDQLYLQLRQTFTVFLANKISLELYFNKNKNYLSSFASTYSKLYGQFKE